MRNLLALAVLVSGIFPAAVSALELANVRPTLGPLGAKRADNKFLPGDLIYLNFDIKDLYVEAKTGGVVYQTTMEILDQAGKSVFKQQTSPQKVVLLGGKQVPTNAYAVLGTGREAGKYKVKITVNDLLGKQEKSVFYDFEILPAGFGLVQSATPAVSFSGLDFSVNFSLVGMKRDEKDKLPDVDLKMQMFDEFGKEVFTKPWELNVQIFHNPPASDLTAKDVIPVNFTLFLNRAGNFSIQIEAVDNLSKEKRQMKLPLKVLDAATYSGN